MNTGHCADSSNFELVEVSGSLSVTNPKKGAQLHQLESTAIEWTGSGNQMKQKVNLSVDLLRRTIPPQFHPQDVARGRCRLSSPTRPRDGLKTAGN